ETDSGCKPWPGANYSSLSCPRRGLGTAEVPRHDSITYARSRPLAADVSEMSQGPRRAEDRTRRNARNRRAQRLQAVGVNSKISAALPISPELAPRGAYAHARVAVSGCIPRRGPARPHGRRPGARGLRADRDGAVLRQEQRALRSVRLAHLHDRSLRDLLLP